MYGCRHCGQTYDTQRELDDHLLATWHEVWDHCGHERDLDGRCPVCEESEAVVLACRVDEGDY